MPKDFGVGSPATVDLGSGANEPQLRFTADDESCMWNECIVILWVSEFVPITPAAPASTYQLSSFTTTVGGGGSRPTAAQWPKLYIYDFLRAVLSGYELEARVRFTATSGGTSVGSIGVCPIGQAACASQPGPIGGVYDSGWIASTCADCGPGFDDPRGFEMNFTNFNPAAGNVTITDGILDMRWVVGSTMALADWEPNQQYQTFWTGPCTDTPTGIPAAITDYIVATFGGPRCGLLIQLPTNSCGVLSKTYTNIAADVNALDLGITASVLGGHGADIVTPTDEIATGVKAIVGTFDGADCTGALDWPYTG